MAAQEEVSLLPGQVCIALDDFEGTEPGDLSFTTGEHITIVRPTELLYWYIGKKATNGHQGTVPGSFLEPIQVDPTIPPARPPKPSRFSPTTPPPSVYIKTPPKSISPTDAPPVPRPALPPKPSLVSYKSPHVQSTQEDEEYEKMGPGGPAPNIPPKSIKKTTRVPMSEEEMEMMRIMEREKVKRYPKGTLVVATATFYAEKPQDMTFRVQEELLLLKPTAELCWYYAQKVDNPSVKGVIPITHVRLVYMSDDDDDSDQIYNKPKEPGHDRLYDDRNDFISHSGWFSFPGMALGKGAQLHLLARKAGLEHDVFVAMKKSVYVLSYRKEKIFVGKADVLHEELMKHFDCYGRKRHEIREIDDELCHHTDSLGWNLQVYEVGPDQDLELEWSKKVFEHNSLISTDGGPGINESLTFTDMNIFDRFWEWLSPN